MLHSIERILAKNYVNFRGQSINRKLVIFESDDWGSIRVFDKRAYNNLLKAGVPVDSDYFDKYDSLESTDDLISLYDTLITVTDSQGNHPVFTLLSIMGNPSFEKIKESNNQKYYYETVRDSYKRKKDTEKSFETIQQGISNGLIYPQFHAKEHINVHRWMKAIQSNNLNENIIFSNKSLIISHTRLSGQGFNYFPTYDFDNVKELRQLHISLAEGLKLFEQIYGFKSVSFCPPCGIIHDDLFETAAKGGVRGLQSGQYFIPQGSDFPLKRVNHFFGEKTIYNQIFWRRNCTFEPARDHNIDWVDKTLAEIKIAFRWGKPAVINSHRVNFIGSLFESNRADSIRQLKKLLKAIVKNWPDVEFINSEQLYYKLNERINHN